MSEKTDRASDDGGAGASSSGPLGLHWIDLWVALVVLVTTGLLYARTYWFDAVPSSLAQNVQPTVFPRLVLGVIAVIALIIPFEHYRKLRHGIDLDADRRERPSPIVPVTGGLLLVLVLAFPWLGALPALVLTALVLPLLWGERRWKILIPYVVIFPTAVIFLFAEVLQVSFPRGLLPLPF